MATYYHVETAHDDKVELQDVLDHIASEGGRVISVTWQPERLRRGDDVEAAFTIVAEYTESDQPALVRVTASSPREIGA